MQKIVVKLEERLLKKERSAIYALQRSLFTWSEHLKKYLYYSSRPKWRILLWHNNQLVGSVSIVIRNVWVGKKRRQLGGIGNLGIREEFQGRGNAMVLLREVEKLLRKEKVDFALLFCDQDRKGFYKKAGYIELEKSATYYSGSKLKRDENPMLLPIILTKEEISFLTKNSLHIGRGIW